MTKSEIPRLCGGTFFTQILLSRRDAVSRRQRTQGKTDIFYNEDVLFALLQIVQPGAIKLTGSSFETYTTNFKKCDGSIGEDLKFGNAIVISALKIRMTENYSELLHDMTAFCEAFIDLRDTNKNHVLLVKRLIELIRDDVISPSQAFVVGRNGEAKLKSELPEITKIHLPSFLLSILEFVVNERSDNRIGKDTISAWHSVPNVKGRYNGIDGSSIKQDIVVTFDYSTNDTEMINENAADENESTPQDEPYIFEEAAEQSASTTNQVIVNGNVFNAKNRFSSKEKVIRCFTKNYLSSLCFKAS